MTLAATASMRLWTALSDHIGPPYAVPLIVSEARAAFASAAGTGGAAVALAFDQGGNLADEHLAHRWAQSFAIS